MEASDSPNPSLSTFKSNNFEVTLTLDDTRLSIHAEDSTLRHFQLIITPEHVQELTSGIFEDLQFMHAGLLEALEGKNPSIKADIKNDGALTYSEEQTFRGLKREKKFILALKEEVMDEAKRQTRRLDLQASKIVELEARIAELEKENNKLQSDLEKVLIEKISNIERVKISEVDEKLNKFEDVFGKKIEKDVIPQIKQGYEKTLLDFERRMLEYEKRIDEKLIQLSPPKIEDYKAGFDPTCSHAAKFSFANDNKSIAYQHSTGYFACLASSPLPKHQKTRFSIKAESISSNAHVMIGICPSSVKCEQNLFSKLGVYCYYGFESGYYYVKGIPSPLNNCEFKTGSVIVIVVDLVNNAISYELNGSQIWNASLDSSKTASCDYYPFVELYNQNDKVSFI